MPAARQWSDHQSHTCIIGARDALLSTMLLPPKSLENRDAPSRKTMNDQRTSAYICAVSVPNETNKEQIAALAARGDQIKTNSAEYLWICCGTPAAAAGYAGPHRSSVNADHLQLQPRPLNCAAVVTRSRP